MKTPIEMLIEQLNQKIERVNIFIHSQEDEAGLYMYTGLLAGFSESKVMAEKLFKNEQNEPTEI
jgi:hypothetical protein